jgi:hypothetical protein
MSYQGFTKAKSGEGKSETKWAVISRNGTGAGTWLSVPPCSFLCAEVLFTDVSDVEYSGEILQHVKIARFILNKRPL